MFPQVLIAAGLALCAREFNHVHHRVPFEGPAILLGDSYGVGLSSEFKRLSSAAGVASYVYAREGSLTREWVKKVDEIMDRDRPKVVFVSLGTNDAGTTRAWLDRNITAYSTIAEKIREHGATVVWITPPSIESDKLKNFEVVRSAIADATYDDEVFDSSKIEIERGPDGIHSTPTGYVNWMKKIWDSAFAHR